MIDTSKWQYFNIMKTDEQDGIFNIENCLCSNATELLEDGDEIEYIGAKKEDNGFMKLVKRSDFFEGKR